MPYLSIEKCKFYNLFYLICIAFTLLYLTKQLIYDTMYNWINKKPDIRQIWSCGGVADMFIYENNDQLKKELKKCIIDNGYTAKMICDKLGMLPQTYQTLINKKNFSFADMKRILDCMGVELHIGFLPVEQMEE